MAGARCVRAKRSPRQRVQAGRPQSLQFGGSRLCAFGFVPIRGQQEHMPRGAVVVRASSFTENDDIGAVQVCRASRCSSAFWMCASLEVLHDLISVVVIQCRQGGNIMASGPPSCSCSRYNSAALVFAPLVSFPSVGNKSTCHVVLWSSGLLLSRRMMTSERSKCAEHLVVLPLSGCARVSRCSTTLSRW